MPSSPPITNAEVSFERQKARAKARNKHLSNRPSRSRQSREPKVLKRSACHACKVKKIRCSTDPNAMLNGDAPCMCVIHTDSPLHPFLTSSTDLVSNMGPFATIHHLWRALERSMLPFADARTGRMNDEGHLSLVEGTLEGILGKFDALSRLSLLRISSRMSASAQPPTRMR